MKISIIIPNYNGCEMLKNNIPVVINALNYFREKTGDNGEVIIIDDCSTDESVRIVNNIQKEYKDVNIKFSINKKNLGFSSTVNEGVRLSAGEIILLLNTDVIPKRDFLISLISHFKNDKVFGVGCMDESVEGENVVLRGRGLGKWRRGFLEHKKGEITRNNTLWVSGGSSAYRRDIWDILGGLYPVYNPFYWEDIDISYRALKAGYALVFEKNSTVSHYHDSGVIKTNFTESNIKVNSYKNQFIFSWINITDKSLMFNHIFWIPFHSFNSIINMNFSFILGLLKACIRIPKIIYYRTKTQKLVKRSDDEVVSEFEV